MFLITRFFAVIFACVFLIACQDKPQPNPLLAETLDALLTSDPLVAETKGTFDAAELIASPTKYVLPATTLRVLLDSRDKEADGSLSPTTEFVLQELGEDKAQIYAKLKLLTNIPLYLPQVMVEKLKVSNASAATQLNNNNTVNFAAQRAARKCYILMETDGTFYNFDDDVSRFNNKLIAQCRKDIGEVFASFNALHSVKDVLGF